MMDDPNQSPSPPTFEQLYGILFDAIPSSLLVVDERLHVVSVNRNFLERSQRQEANILGRPLAEVFPAILLENTNLVGCIREVFHSGQPLRGRRMTYRAPGISIRTYYYSVLPVTLHAHTSQVMLLMEDITEQVRLSKEVHLIERQLASVVESASDIMFSTDTAGRILTWNSAAEQHCGLSFEEVRGRHFFEWCDPAQREEVRRALVLMQCGNASCTSEWRLVGSNGEGLLVSWVFSPMKDDYGNTIGVVAVGRDRTERRKLEDELRQSQKLAALGVMAGGIAHELRNPLAVCASAAQFLMEEGLDPAFRIECLEKIQTGIWKASTIIENLLRFARPGPETNMSEVNLTGVLAETLTLIGNLAKVQKIQICHDLGGRKVWLRGVPSLLEHVFMNLFLNAINAMPDGGHLRLTMMTSDSEVVVAVTDTGWGIPASKLDKVFDPFLTTAPQGKGTGLGLSICYSIVRQHLGTIGVESRFGEGTTVTVRLPLL